MLEDKSVTDIILEKSDTEVLTKEPKNGSPENNVTAAPVQKRDMGGRRCRVVYSYAPQHDDELALCVGQTITILQEVEEGWWKGVLDGQVGDFPSVGMFPSNFVEEVQQSSNDDVPGKQSEPNVENINNINNQLNINGQSKEIKPKPIQGMGYGVKLTDLKKEARRDTEPPQPHPHPHPHPHPQHHHSATTNGSAKILGSTASAFHPIHKDTPRENGPVKNFRDLPHKLPPALEPKTEKVTNKTDKTRLNAADRDRINSLEKDRTPSRSPDDRAKGEGSGKHLVPQPAPHGGQPLGIPTHPPPPQLPPKPIREVARVMFPYSAEHEDELELHEGDIITVLCKDLEDRGWWRGEMNGKVGVFPDNFVELITIEENTKPPRPEKPATVLAKRSPSSSTDSTPTSTLSKNDKEPPPPLPEKKVAAPPPPEKKHGTPSPTPDTTPTSSTSQDSTNMSIFKRSSNSSKASNSMSGGEEVNLSLDTEGEKLRHVTHLRPKGPSHRRPPSGIFKENMKTNETDSHLTPTPEDEVDHDGGGSGLEMQQSTSVPSLILDPPTAPARPPDPRPRPEPHPRPDTSPTSTSGNPPWLQELGLKQKQKRLSGIHSQPSDGEGGGNTAPPVSPKPVVNLHLKTEDKPTPKPHRSVSDTVLPTEAPSIKSRSSEPSRLPDVIKPTHPTSPSPEYEHKPFAPQPPKSKPPPPAAPQAHTPTEGRRVLPIVNLRHPSPNPPSSTSPVSSKKPPPPVSEAKDINKTSTVTNAVSPLEEKVDALFKEFIPKIKQLEERLEEQRREQGRRIQMLMNDLDDERKQRACMAVEIERLRKLVDAYAQV